MTCLPYAADLDRTVLDTWTVDDSNDWWTGLVHDRDHDTGERRLRLERWVDNGNSCSNPHTWRVRPDFWEAERDAVATFERRGGRSPPARLPIDNRLTPLEYTCIRKDDTRWVAVVRVDRPYKSPCIRLYHWNPADAALRQKWTVGRHWAELKDLATRQLRPVA
ncbi:hypothetical protein [Haloterrigena alkaliphila]|nr:hypothetical protein [Haloterrigena alkaliphila]QSX00102.2 hypothetical protein J0X25_03805 [Haloterrigena alkaliphila]